MVEAGRQVVAISGGPWAAYFAGSTAAAAAMLRLHPDLQALQSDDGLWIRGDTLTHDLDALLRKLAPTLRCSILADGQLVPEGLRIPHGYLPQGQWRPLRETITPLPPPLQPPGSLPRKIPLVLTRREGDTSAAALLTDVSALCAYADTAPAVRLNRLSFAMRPDGKAIVRGTPLPPIAGMGLTESDGLLIPCGWGWDPPVPSSVVRQVLGLQDGQLALVSPDGAVQTIEAAQFVRVSRAAVRQSARNP